MIFELVKRDPAWRNGILFGLMTAAMLLIDQAVGGDPDPWFQLVNVQVLLIASGMSCRHVRATLFEASLPIEGRQLFLARLLSRLAMVWLQVFAAILVILPGRGTGWPQVLGMLQCGTLFTLAYLLPLSVRVRECAAPVGLLAALWTGLAVTGALAWHFLPPGVFLSVFALAGVLILRKTWFAIPAGFQVAPIEAVASIARPRSTHDAPMLAWWPIVRSAGFAMPAFVFLMGNLLGWSGGSGGSAAPFAGGFLMIANLDVRQRTRWLYALPLSFRALNLIVLVPSLALLLAGIAIGTCFDTTRPSDYSLVRGPRSQSRSDVDIDVNFEFWYRAPAGKAPVIGSPWGETVDAATVRVLGVTFFNPYSVGPRSSDRFVQWQFERATQAVYGRVIPLFQYGAASDAGLVPVTARPRVRVLGLSADLLLILMLVYLTEWTRWHRLPRLPEGLRSALPFVSVLVVLAIDAFVEWFYSFPLGTAVLHATLLQLSNLLPDNLLVVTAVAMVPVVGMYWLIEKQFSRSELLGPMRQPSAWDRIMQAE